MIKNLNRFFTLFLFSLFPAFAGYAEREEGTIKLEQRSAEFAKLYEIPPDCDFVDITDKVLGCPLVDETQKQAIQELGRQIFLFTYPSDGLKIKGLVSFIPDLTDSPLLVLLRGGSKIFGIPNPGLDLMCAAHYTVLASIYRGGVSEGVDEYGGKDVNDVKDLMSFLPQLEERLNLSLHKEKSYLLGRSRGDMQMFLALARFPELQKKFSKIVSLSGLHDLDLWMRECPEMKETFQIEFGLTEENEEEWVKQRDPILATKKMDPQLPLLIIQGTQDNRLSLEQGYRMVNHLQSKGHNVTYWEIEGGDHCLENTPNRVQLILEWLESF